MFHTIKAPHIVSLQYFIQFLFCVQISLMQAFVSFCFVDCVLTFIYKNKGKKHSCKRRIDKMERKFVNNENK